jgi:hypothetical protein
MWTTYVCIVCDSQFTLSFISNVMKMNQALGTNSHLSKIPTASARLQACIEVLRQITPNPAPILFVGDGLMGFSSRRTRELLTGPHESNKLLGYQM